MDALLIAALVVYGLTSCLLFAFGLNLARHSWLAWRHRREAVPDLHPGEGDAAAALPVVTVQLPIYNELFVARRVIDAACRLDYPRDRLQIQVLDDSDDETSAVVAAAVEVARSAGVDIDHVRRRQRTGYKAGALAAGLRRARGSLVAVFDADFVPPTDFLRRAVPAFADPAVAFVQGRWGHLNGDHSWLTKLQVPAIDGHFLVEQRSRGLRGHWFNFNGTAGIWRTSAIEDAGGWHHDTLTEDLDLSYRAHLRGWRGVYLPDLVVPGELPAQLSGFRRQQHRWARGSLECAAKLLQPIWRSGASLGVKLQASMHLCAYTVHPLLVVLLLSYPFVLAASERFGLGSALHGVGSGLAPASATPAVFLLVGQAVQDRAGWRRLAAIPSTVVFGAGLMVNTTRAAIEIVTKPNAEFERTAKFGLGLDDAGPVPSDAARYHRPALGGVWVELALGGYGLATAARAFVVGSWGIFAFATLFATGLIAVATTTIAQSVGRRSDRSASRDREPRRLPRPEPARR